MRRCFTLAALLLSTLLLLPAAVLASPVVDPPAGPPRPSPAATTSDPTLMAEPETAPQFANRPRADYLLVDKTARSLQVFSAGHEIARYPIQLGKQPLGHKEREGDHRTPEGIYHIDWRNPNSAFFLSMQISYPNSEDRARAAAAGDRPGGLIMIHGMPNNVDYRREVWDEPNWTNGCIALRDHHIAELWELVDIGTPIEIRP